MAYHEVMQLQPPYMQDLILLFERQFVLLYRQLKLYLGHWKNNFQHLKL
ncbi:unnamed protein product [Schistosoma margrebowiei]|uniref:Uncharacterized protein n=1 Tax=Schistosoma margrebowiei TaxID=48269 RepID=A0A183LUH5_9TREM|nr:unnamed protein product [Schistosoma margrebowiei]